ncbi:MAG: GAF domain-containing protein, partial [Pseudomonadota bacterium]
MKTRVEKEPLSVRFNGSKLRERNRALSLLLEMGSFLSGALGRKNLFPGALERVLKAFDLKAGRFYLIDQSAPCLNLVAYRGLEPDGLERVNINEGFTGKAFRTRSLIIHPVSLLDDEKRANLLVEKGFKTIICIPLINMGKVRGVINMASEKTLDLDQEKIDLANVLGNQVAAAVDNARLFEELDHKMAVLQEKKDTIKLFAYSVSHDLKGPSVGIYGLTKRLREKYGHALDEKGRAYCDQILDTSKQMMTLIEKINDFISAKETPPTLEKINIKDLTKSLKAELSEILEKRQIRWSEPDTIPEIRADRLAISRALWNFADNALKYGGDEMHEIKIGYEQTNGYHVLSFSDDGIGIKA